MIDTVEKKQSPIWIKLWPVYVIAAGLALAVSQGWHQYLTLESLSENAVWLDELVKNNLLLPHYFWSCRKSLFCPGIRKTRRTFG